MDAVKFWKEPEVTTTVTYTFDTVEDSHALCTVTVVDGEVATYSGVYALDLDIVERLENDGVRVPASCRY